MEYGIKSTSLTNFDDFIKHFKMEDKMKNNLPDKKFKKFNWALINGVKAKETSQTALILRHFNDHLLPVGFRCNADTKSIEVKIPVNYKMFVGKVDAIVFNTKYDLEQMATLTYVSIEIKPYLESAENMVISSVEFLVLGMILRSCFPVLHIQTNMEAFK